MLNLFFLLQELPCEYSSSWKHQFSQSKDLPSLKACSQLRRFLRLTVVNTADHIYVAGRRDVFVPNVRVQTRSPQRIQLITGALGFLWSESASVRGSHARLTWGYPRRLLKQLILVHRGLCPDSTFAPWLFSSLVRYTRLSDVFVTKLRGSLSHPRRSLQ